MNDSPPAGSEPARRAAESAVRTGLDDPDLAVLAEAEGDEPVVVNATDGTPSYWLVLFRIDGAVRGFARVGFDDSVVAVGRYGGGGAWLEADEAAARAADELESDETAMPPMLVHDGPPGREAWLVETRVEGVPARWLFVTQGGVYDRAAGVQRDLDVE